MRCGSVRRAGRGVAARYDEVARLLTGWPQVTAQEGVEVGAELVRTGISPLAKYGFAAEHVPQLITKRRQRQQYELIA